MPESELRAALIANGAVSALCGTRIHPDVLPQNSPLPAVAYTRIWSERDSAMGADTTVVTTQVQFTCFAKSGVGVSGYDKALELADAVRAVLQRYRSSVVQDCFVVNETTTYERDTLYFGRVLDFRVHYWE